MKKITISIIICIILLVFAPIANNTYAYSSNAEVTAYHLFYNYCTAYAFFTSSSPRVNGTLSSSAYALNCFTGYSFYSGCPVTTYQWSGSQYMCWRERQCEVGEGETITFINAYTPGNERNYCLQIRRIGTTPEVNISYLVGNYANDVRIYASGTNYYPLSEYATSSGTTSVIIAVPPRLSYSTRYISIGSSISGYPGKYCHWDTAGSSFYCVVMGNGDTIGWAPQQEFE